MNILDIAELCGSTVAVRVRPEHAPHVYVSISGVELARDGLLMSICGNGNSLADAVADYMGKVRAGGKQGAQIACLPDRWPVPSGIETSLPPGWVDIRAINLRPSVLGGVR